MIYQGKARYPVHELILHTPAVSGGWHKGKTVDQMCAEFDRWHRRFGWSGVGYHRILAPDGTMAVGRSLWQIGAHVIEANRGTIGLCMVNSVTHDGIKAFEDYFTPAQRDALVDYVGELRLLTDLRKISGHNDYAKKECPGFKVGECSWIQELLR